MANNRTDKDDKDDLGPDKPAVPEKPGNEHKLAKAAIKARSAPAGAPALGDLVFYYLGEETPARVSLVIAYGETAQSTPELPLMSLAVFHPIRGMIWEHVDPAKKTGTDEVKPGHWYPL